MKKTKIEQIGREWKDEKDLDDCNWNENKSLLVKTSKSDSRRLHFCYDIILPSEKNNLISRTSIHFFLDRRDNGREGFGIQYVFSKKEGVYVPFQEEGGRSLPEGYVLIDGSSIQSRSEMCTVNLGAGNPGYLAGLQNLRDLVDSAYPLIKNVSGISEEGRNLSDLLYRKFNEESDYQSSQHNEIMSRNEYLVRNHLNEIKKYSALLTADNQANKAGRNIFERARKRK